MNKKRVFKSLFFYLSIILVLSPFILTFNNIFTRIFESFSFYRLIQEEIVPIQVQTVGLVIKAFGIDYIGLKDGMIVNNIQLRLTWNCLGWQSLILFFVSFIVATYGGKFTLGSRLETVFLGLFGIYWINIFRMCLTILLAVYSGPIFRVVFHDYLAAFVSVLFLLFFWWFSYSFILKNKKDEINADRVE